jgi:hypothetical protein
VAEERGAREQALEVRVPIWGIGGKEAHRGGLTVVTQVSGGGNGDDRPEKRWRAPSRGSWSSGELERRSLW